MRTILSSNLPDPVSVLRNTLEKANQKKHLSSSDISLLLKRVSHSPESISVTQYEKAEELATSLYGGVLEQRSNQPYNKACRLSAVLKVVLDKMPPSAIDALKEKKCEEGKRITEYCENRLNEVVTHKERDINKLRDDLIKFKKDFNKCLMSLPEDKKALARKCVKNNDYAAFIEHRQEYFPAKYTTVERPTKYGGKCYQAERVLSDVERKWIDTGFNFRQVSRIEEEIKELKAEVAGFSRVDVDNLNFPILTAEQAQHVPESDYQRKAIAWTYNLKELVAQRLKAKK